MDVLDLVNTGTAVALDLRQKLKGTGLKAVIAITIDSTSYVTLQGSLDGTNYFVIETFSSNTIKEVTLVPYLRVNGAADTSDNDTIGSSTAKVFFSQDAFQR